ncbi:hypothetical protein LZ24_03380 [Desulfobotulus alkaliphilus]|uniref:Uncharacterized protein n=1 Tax=Desulfobotulus alkaliphilus TaxID=622671 RepID=A0A562R098_9BACT|nr:hypothetical protein LZ24_03380 [Desulfobotulus alkaliphilus]
MGEKGRVRISAHFTTESMCRSTLNLYEGALDFLEKQKKTEADA